MTREEFLKLCQDDPDAAADKFIALQEEVDQFEIDYYESAKPVDFDDDDIPF